MSNYARLHCLVEGPTELNFVESLLRDYLAHKGVVVTASLIGKQGGDIRFDRAKNDLKILLLGDKKLYVTFIIDFYGTTKIKWPGLAEATVKATTHEKAATVKTETAKAVASLVSDASRRFIPYVSMHEFEALFFSNPDILAEMLDLRIDDVHKIRSLKQPEDINNSPTTAPSKRLETLYPRYKKVGTGMALAKRIGIATMREACPLFNQWLTTIENLPSMP